MKINKRILKSIKTLPPFPVTIQKVMALAGDPDSSLTELAAVIRLDQAITANILRICNSAYFGLRRPVDNVNDAIMHMGRKTSCGPSLPRGFRGISAAPGATT